MLPLIDNCRAGAGTGGTGGASPARNLPHFITAASCGQSPGGIFRANNDRRIHVNRVFCISPLRFGMRELNSAPSACIVTFRDFTMAETLFEQVGGEAKLREIIGVFIDRVFENRMIGFFFRNADRARIKEMEYQLTAQFLGAPVEYTGRRLDLAHAKHPIMGGQFERRRKMLRDTLEDFQVPAAVRDAWLEHNERLRALITPNRGSDCDPAEARKKPDRKSTRLTSS